MHKLIFEGPELAGKSYVIHGVWDFLERKYNLTNTILDGCIWFNADVGIFGTDFGWPVIKKYIEIGNILKSKCVIFEKFHITNHIYTNYKNSDVFTSIDQILYEEGFELIHVSSQFSTNEIQQRINDRLKSNSSYARIAKPPDWYKEKRDEYINLVNESKLKSYTVTNTYFPNNNHEKVLRWLGEV